MGKELSEFQRPAADGLVADLDPALGHEVFDVAKAQRETEIQPNRVADDVRRESVTGIGYGLHRFRLPAFGAQASKPEKPRPTRHTGDKVALA